MCVCVCVCVLTVFLGACMFVDRSLILICEFDSAFEDVNSTNTTNKILSTAHRSPYTSILPPFFPLKDAGMNDLSLSEGLQADLPLLSSPHLPDGPLEMPLFQLIPSQRQLVFRGDRLPLQCTASYLDQSVELRWHHNGHVVSTQEDRGVYVEETLLHDCCLLTRYM